MDDPFPDWDKPVLVNTDVLGEMEFLLSILPSFNGKEINKIVPPLFKYQDIKDATTAEMIAGDASDDMAVT